MINGSSKINYCNGRWTYLKKISINRHDTYNRIEYTETYSSRHKLKIMIIILYVINWIILSMNYRYI